MLAGGVACGPAPSSVKMPPLCRRPTVGTERGGRGGGETMSAEAGANHPPKACALSAGVRVAGSHGVLNQAAACPRVAGVRSRGLWGTGQEQHPAKSVKGACECSLAGVKTGEEGTWGGTPHLRTWREKGGGALQGQM